MVPVTVHHSDSTIKAPMANLKDDKRMFVSSARTQLYPGTTVVIDQTQARTTDITAVPASISANANDGLENSLPRELSPLLKIHPPLHH